MRTDEIRRPGDPPLWDVPDWWARHGIVAGITGRRGRAGDFDLGLWTDRPVGEVMGRWRAFRDAVPGFTAQVMAHQVHGSRIIEADATSGWVIHDGADGHVTTGRGVLLMVTVADCVPVYLAAPGRGMLALLHAGWRGTAAGILAGAIGAFRQRGIAAQDLVMHAGVAISGPCYEVGAEVIEGVGRTAAGPGPWHLDLREVLVEQGRAHGIGEITVSGHCTCRENAEFFSHRASGGRDGRMVAFLGMPRQGDT